MEVYSMKKSFLKDLYEGLAHYGEYLNHINN